MKRYGEQAGLFCLNRGWKFIEKDFSVLPAGREHDDIYGYSKGGAQKGPAEAAFDDSDWEEVELPHDWVAGKPVTEKGSLNQGYKERGIGWYRLRFRLEEEDCQKQILLEFEGMSADAEIFVNGMRLKRSFSGYNSFVVDMTDMAQFGDQPNTLAVRIDASAWEGWWYEGAGIYRNVWLIKKTPVHIAAQGVWICPEKISDQKWQLTIRCEIENSFEVDKDVWMRHQILDKRGMEIASVEEGIFSEGFSKKETTVCLTISDPDLWDTGHPDLYQVKTSLYDRTELDYQYHSFGFRTIELRADNGFWLNGKNIKLLGFCNHQDHAGVGVAVSYNLKEYRMRKLLDLGANAYRQAHNPDPEILDICDRLGILVMDENRTFSSAADNLEEVKNNIKNARNHPCVVMYSVFNEEPLQGTPKGRRMAGRLRAAVREMDTTRPVLGAFNGGYMEENGAATILDAVGINYNPMRYDEFHHKYPDIPLLGSETASAFMVRGEYETDWEAHQIDNFDDSCALWGNTVREAWRYVTERPFVAGTFVWTGFDYRGEPTPFAWPSAATFFGTYDSCGFEKDACFLYRAFWKKEPLVHLISGWKDRKNKGKTIKVMVTTNCEKVRLYRNGQLAAEKEADPIGQVAFELECEQGELKAEGINGDCCVAEDIQRTSQVPVRLALTDETGSVYAGGHDVIVVNAALLDKNGTVVSDDDRILNFRVENGRIIGVGNGDPNSHEPDVADHRASFHGLAQVIIKPSSEKTVRLLAETEGLEPAELLCPVLPADSIPYMDPVEEEIIEGWRLYFRLFDEMPDPTMTTDRNDMNSFEPVYFSGNPQPELSEQLGKYGMYRTEHTFLQKETGRSRLYFGHVEGLVWIYLDGSLIAERTEAFGGDIAALLPEGISGRHEITVIVKNDNRAYPQAGICSQVLCQQQI